MKNQADYSQYRCPFDHMEKECGHELQGPEGFCDDDRKSNAFRIWCPCGFRGPAFYLDPEKLRVKKKTKKTLGKLRIERKTVLDDWEVYAYPTEDFALIDLEFFREIESMQKFPKELRLVRETIEVLA